MRNESKRARASERKWLATGDTASHAAFLAKRLRENSLDPNRLDLAAALGCPAAREITQAQISLPKRHADVVEKCAESLLLREAVHLCLKCFRHSLASAIGLDVTAKIKDSVNLVKSWLKEPGPIGDFDDLIDDISEESGNLRAEADDVECTPEVTTHQEIEAAELHRKASVLNSLSHILIAISTDLPGSFYYRISLAPCVSESLAEDLNFCANNDQERMWQINTLCEVLLN